MTSWKFAEEKPRVGAESALDACDYFGDEVIEPWKVLGTVDYGKVKNYSRTPPLGVPRSSIFLTEIE